MADGNGAGPGIRDRVLAALAGLIDAAEREGDPHAAGVLHDALALLSAPEAAGCVHLWRTPAIDDPGLTCERCGAVRLFESIPPADLARVIAEREGADREGFRLALAGALRALAASVDAWRPSGAGRQRSGEGG